MTLQLNIIMDILSKYSLKSIGDKKVHIIGGYSTSPTIKITKRNRETEPKENCIRLPNVVR